MLRLICRSNYAIIISGLLIEVKDEHISWWKSFIEYTCRLAEYACFTCWKLKLYKNDEVTDDLSTGYSFLVTPVSKYKAIKDDASNSLSVLHPKEMVIR